MGDERQEKKKGFRVRTVAVFLAASALAGWVTGRAGRASADEEEKKAEEKKDFAADKGPDTIDVKEYPKKLKAAYKVYSSKCSRCHTLARSINTDLTARAWLRYVKRMMNKPDSGISPKMGKQIYQFLKFHQKKKDAAKEKAKEKTDEKKEEVR